MRKIILIMILFCLLVVAGCATVVHGTKEQIPVSSEPGGAQVKVDGEGIYQTPVTLVLERKKDHLLEISKDGFFTEKVAIKRKLSPALAGDVVMPGGTVGLGVDVIDGAACDLSPEKVHVILKPVQQEAKRQ